MLFRKWSRARSIGALVTSEETDMYDMMSVTDKMSMARMIASDRKAALQERGIHEADDVNWIVKFVVEVTIIVNTLQLGVCAQPSLSTGWERACSSSEHVFMTIFLAEVLMKLHLIGFKKYFSTRWNVFDFLITFSAIVDSWVLQSLLSSGTWNMREFSALRAMRLFRLARIAKLVQHHAELAVIMEGLLGALRAIFWVALVLGLLIYSVAIVCVTLFSEVPSSSPLTFENVPRAMFTLFSLSILADWTDVIMPVISEYWWAQLFFVFFTFLTSFGILNLIIGVITERTAMAQNEYRLRVQMLLDRLRMERVDEISELIFENANSMISQSEMAFIVREPETCERIQALLATVSLPEGYEIWHAHSIFDRDGDGVISRHEFQQGMKRLIMSDDFQQRCIIQTAIADVFAELKAVEARVLDKIDDRLETWKQDVCHKQSAEDNDGCPPSLPPPPPPPRPRLPTKVAIEGVGLVSQSPSLQTDEENLAAISRLVERLREPLMQLLGEGLPTQAMHVGAGSASGGPPTLSAPRLEAKRGSGVADGGPPWQDDRAPPQDRRGTGEGALQRDRCSVRSGGPSARSDGCEDVIDSFLRRWAACPVCGDAVRGEQRAQPGKGKDIAEVETQRC